MTNVRWQFGCEISYFIMTNRWKTTLWAWSTESCFHKHNEKACKKVTIQVIFLCPVVSLYRTLIMTLKELVRTRDRHMIAFSPHVIWYSCICYNEGYCNSLSHVLIVTVIILALSLTEYLSIQLSQAQVGMVGLFAALNLLVARESSSEYSTGVLYCCSQL